MRKETKIHVLTVDNNPNSFSFAFPLLINRKGLLDRGIKVKIFYLLEKGLYDCDILFVDNKFFRPWWRRKENEYIYKFLENSKSKVGAVLWFDTSDSTGTPQFEVLPYVDGYYKNQILKDVKQYCKTYYSTRIYADYYHRKYGTIETTDTGREFPLDPQYINKIHSSWNPGLNDHGLFGNTYSLQGEIAAHLRRYSMHNFVRYTSRFIRVKKPRKVNITARLGFDHSRNFVIVHRKLLMEKLKKFNVDTKFIGHSSYYKELQNVKLSISPFGLGEISYRDFETLVCGALLIKPDMGHMETWPDIYIDNRTYISCAWNFSDLEEKIDDLLSNPKKMQDIAMDAQRNYRYYLFGAGRMDFCDRVYEMIERYIDL